MSNLNNVTTSPTWNHATSTLFQVNAGAAGYVDTDVSAVTGTDTNKIWLVVHYTTGAGCTAGVRANGSSVDVKVPNIVKTSAWLSHVSATGHLDLYRDAASNNFYYPVGYLG